MIKVAERFFFYIPALTFSIQTGRFFKAHREIIEKRKERLVAQKHDGFFHVYQKLFFFLHFLELELTVELVTMVKNSNRIQHRRQIFIFLFNFQ